MVTKPQAVIWPSTVEAARPSCFNRSYKTASGNLAFNTDQPQATPVAPGYKTASGNLAFNPVARTRLTERAKSPTMENQKTVHSKNS